MKVSLFFKVESARLYAELYTIKAFTREMMRICNSTW